MKKIMFMLGAVALAASVQAASVAWNSGTNANGFKDADGNTLKNSELYTVIVTFYGTDGTSILGTDTATKAKATGAYTATYSGYDFAAGSTYYASAIIKANDGTSERETSLASFTIAEDGSDASINFMTGAGFTTADQKWATSWTTGGGGDGTPEPTSGLLLLVGAGLLGLRRKQR